MSRASDYFKYFELTDATALAADILLGKIGYILGGRVVGQGDAPVGSLTAFYSTNDATITSESVGAWKIAYGKLGKILGTYYPGPIPAYGGLMDLNKEAALYDAAGDNFSI